MVPSSPPAAAAGRALRETPAAAALGAAGAASGAWALQPRRCLGRTRGAGCQWSPRYRDLALGPSLFHWESQSVSTAASPTGQRTIHHQARGSRVLLFVREHRKEGGRSGGITEPFRCLGFARYGGHEGERPMAIRWRLEVPIPAAWLPGMALAV